MSNILILMNILINSEGMLFEGADEKYYDQEAE
jgi:hypothetical protein